MEGDLHVGLDGGLFPRGDLFGGFGADGVEAELLGEGHDLVHFVGVDGALGIGLGAGVICYISVTLVKVKLGYDDALDAFGVHGVGGMWGALATGLWATEKVNGVNGLFYGNPVQFLIQIKAVLITVIYSFLGTYILLKVVDKIVGLRVTEHEERIGLDLTDHREVGYTLVD